MNAQEKLTEAKKKFELLKLNQDEFSIVERLMDANEIKKNIAQDSVIEEECRHNHVINKTRGELIDTILDFQRSIVENVSISTCTDACKNKIDFDYAETKKKLIELISHTISNVDHYNDDRHLLGNFERLNVFLREIQDNLLDDRYKILLMAKYQSGKTTTLKAFCGGMDIGVTGKGDATTAVPSEVKYSNEERIDVIWKTKEEVREIFSLENYMPELKDIDLDDQAIREEMLRKIEDIRTQENYRNNNAIEASRYYALCSFVLKYWGTPELDRIRENMLTKQDVLKYSTFPQFPTKEKWYQVWETRGMESFPMEKCIFVFMKKISISLPFKTLEMMNGLIVDCPGLFASAYDTKVTEDLMRTAEAILFIISQGSTIGEDESEIYIALKKLKERYSDYESKLFIADNKSFLIGESLENMIPSDERAVYRLFGNNVPFFGYDAKFAYLEQIKKTYDNNDLDENSIKSFILQNPKIEYVRNPITGKRESKSIQCNTFDEAWENAINEYELKNFSIGDSNFDELLKSIQTFIEQNKAYALIVTEGINKIEHKLIDIQTNLAKDYKEPYLKGRQELESIWKRRIQKAQEFENFANDEIDNRLFEVQGDTSKSLCKRLSESIYKKLFSNEIYDSLCDEISSIIFDKILSITYLKIRESRGGQFALNLLGNFSESIGVLPHCPITLKEYMNDLVGEQIESTISHRFNYWNTLLSSDQDVDFKYMFADSVNKFKNDIERRWRDIYRDDELLRDQMYSYYYVSSSISHFIGDYHNCVRRNMDVNDSAIGEKFFMDLSGLALALAGIVGGIVAIIIMGGPLSLLIAAVTTAGGFLGKSKLKKRAEKEFKEGIKPDIKKQLKASGLDEEIMKIVSNNVSQLLTAVKRKTILDMKKLQAQRDQAMANLDSADKEERCFMAVNMMQFLGEQVTKYEKFKESLIP